MNSKREITDVVKKIVENELPRLDDAQTAVFRKYSVEPHLAPISRYGRMDSVVVVARKGDEAIYWNDVEEGFNLSPIDPAGRILEHWCNQDDLGLALNGWIDGRVQTARLGPAEPIE